MARRRVPGFSFLLMVCALSAAGNLPGQTGGTVKGTVTDAVTGSPLVNTNVYLSSTTLGTTTREDGTYTLLHIPQGLYQIVASRVGHRLMSALIRVAPAETLCTNFSLEPVMLQSEEVQVVAPIDKEWRRLLGQFTRAFIGEGRNAEHCRLLNPEVLNLSMVTGTNILVATTDSVLRIENRALGYMLYVRLGTFEWDVNDDGGKYALYPRFEQLPFSDAAGKDWRSNRTRTYRGSLKHFLSSLVRGRLEQEGFIVNSGKIGSLRAGLFSPLSPENFTLEAVPGQGLWKLRFSNWLRVNYRSEQERLTSYIHLVGGPAVLDSAGSLADPLCIEVTGDWRTYRVADMLPLN
jgi:hypothetical protein